MSAVNLLAFGVTCEIRDDDCVPVVQDHLRLPPQEAQALLEAERLKFKERNSRNGARPNRQTSETMASTSISTTRSGCTSAETSTSVAVGRMPPNTSP